MRCSRHSPRAPGRRPNCSSRRGSAARSAALAARLRLEEADALAEAAGYLREMSAVHDSTVTAWWRRFGNWMTRGYDVLVDEDGSSVLRRLDRRHALVFLIPHRSYLDEFVLPPLLQTERMSPLFGLAGRT